MHRLLAPVAFAALCLAVRAAHAADDGPSCSSGSVICANTCEVLPGSCERSRSGEVFCQVLCKGRTPRAESLRGHPKGGKQCTESRCSLDSCS